jgi:F-type H+-transporting ATPase subunit epsilon
MQTFKLEFVTPDEAWALENVVSVDVPGAAGRLAVLARHQPLVCLLRPGAVHVTTADGRRAVWQIAAGTLTVQPQGAAIVTPSAKATAPPRTPAG